MKKILLILLLAISLLSSCSKKEEILKVGIAQQPANFDVQRNSTQTAKVIAVSNIYEKLLTVNKTGGIVLELASDMKMSSDATTYNFTLRKGVLFHNEKEMKAEDVVASLNRWIDNYQVARNIVGDARFYEVDDYTVEIKADKSILFLADLMSHSPQSAVIMPKEVVEDLDKNGFVKSYIGTGVYKFSDWQIDQYVELVKFDKYKPYGGANIFGLAGTKKGIIKTIRYYFITDALIRTLSCENGDLHFVNDVSNDDIERLEGKEGLNIAERNEEGSLVLIFNKRSYLGSDNNFRKAINTGIDCDVLMRSCYGNSGYVLHPNYMEKNLEKWQVEGLEEYYNQNDKEKAKEILKESNYNGEIVKILSSNLSNLDKVAYTLQSELAKIGIRSIVEVADWATFMELRKNDSSYDLFISAFTAVPLPSQKHFLDPTYAGWSEDEKLASLVDEFNRATTLEDAQKVWKEIHLYCYEYLPAIQLGHYQTTYLYNDQIENVVTDFGFYFWNTKFSN